MKRMKPEAQRIAIAEACGWHRAPQWDDEVGCHYAYEHKDGRICYKLKLPDYLNDLNAMRGAEGVLGGEKRVEYLDALLDVLELNLGPGGWDMDFNSVWQMTAATAAQRAEALLRTLGKWEEA
jgi:hypothetical protein